MLNEQIAASTAAKERLAGLEGKRFAVVVRGSDLRIVATAKTDTVELELAPAVETDVELEAGVFDLLRLARSASLSDLKSVDASLNGDIRIAEQFAELMRLAMPEPEALLADWVGDMPAHLLGTVARRTASWGARAERSLEQDMAEYLQEENPTLVPPALARHFSDEVDRIRDDVERAKRRVELLEQRLGTRGPTR